MATIVEDVVDVFEKMCTVPIKEDMILYETGTFSFSEDIKENIFDYIRESQAFTYASKTMPVHIDIYMDKHERFKGAYHETKNINSTEYHH